MVFLLVCQSEKVYVFVSIMKNSNLVLANHFKICYDKSRCRKFIATDAGVAEWQTQ